MESTEVLARPKRKHISSIGVLHLLNTAAMRRQVASGLFLTTYNSLVP